MKGEITDFWPIEKGGNSFAQSMKNIFVKSIDDGHTPRIVGISCNSDSLQKAINKIMPENDFTIPELITEVEEKIKTFTKLLLKLKCLNPKTIEETAESFIERGETEYQKIMNETAERVMSHQDFRLNKNGDCTLKAE